MNKTNTVEQTVSGQDAEASGETIESLLGLAERGV